MFFSLDQRCHVPLEIRKKSKTYSKGHPQHMETFLLIMTDRLTSPLHYYYPNQFAYNLWEGGSPAWSWDAGGECPDVLKGQSIMLMECVCTLWGKLS